MGRLSALSAQPERTADAHRPRRQLSRRMVDRGAQGRRDSVLHRGRVRLRARPSRGARASHRVRSHLPPADRTARVMTSGPGNGPVPPAAVAAPTPSPALAPPPRPVSAADREAFEGLGKDSVSSVRSMASSWRTGLTALITLVTTGIIITGRNSTTNMPVHWRIGVTAAIGGGLLLALAGLWIAL